MLGGDGAGDEAFTAKCGFIDSEYWGKSSFPLVVDLNGREARRVSDERLSWPPIGRSIGGGSTCDMVALGSAVLLVHWTDRAVQAIDSLSRRGGRAVEAAVLKTFRHVYHWPPA